MPRPSEVNYYLKPEDSTGKCLIYLQFKYKGNKLVYSFGEMVARSNWNRKKHRVKNSNEPCADGSQLLNGRLDELAKECLRVYNESKAQKKVIDTDTFRDKLKAFLFPDEVQSKELTFYGLIDKFISGEIKHRGKEKKQATLDAYEVTLNHLKAFEKAENYRIDFDTIDLDFYNKFVGYLASVGNNPNTIGGRVKNLKTFMHEAVDRELTGNIKFKNKKFIKPSNETDGVYLKDAELLKLYRHDFSENKRLEQIRDLFIFGCYVGLRFGDYNNIKPENVVKDGNDIFIKVVTQKTENLAIIPCNPVVLELFAKYQANKNQLPKSVSNQKFNDYIKEVCKAAEMTEKGRLSTDLKKPLWECVSSHTARRSFATNLYLDGYPTIEIMKITGHKTETAFLKYIKVTKQDAARKLNEHIKKNWSAKVLKVA